MSWYIYKIKFFLVETVLLKIKLFVWLKSLRRPKVTSVLIWELLKTKKSRVQRTDSMVYTNFEFNFFKTTRLPAYWNFTIKTGLRVCSNIALYEMKNLPKWLYFQWTVKKSKCKKRSKGCLFVLEDFSKLLRHDIYALLPVQSQTQIQPLSITQNQNNSEKSIIRIMDMQGTKFNGTEKKQTV